MALTLFYYCQQSRTMSFKSYCIIYHVISFEQKTFSNTLHSLRFLTFVLPFFKVYGFLIFVLLLLKYLFLRPYVIEECYEHLNKCQKAIVSCHHIFAVLQKDLRFVLFWYALFYFRSYIRNFFSNLFMLNCVFRTNTKISLFSLAKIYFHNEKYFYITKYYILLKTYLTLFVNILWTTL